MKFSTKKPCLREVVKTILLKVCQLFQNTNNKDDNFNNINVKIGSNI